jgi:hypothetical protein
MKNNVAFSFGRTFVGVAIVATFSCSTALIKGVNAIEPSLDRAYIAYPPEFIANNLAAEVPVMSIAGDIFLLLVPAIKSTHTTAANGLSNL